MVNCEVGLENLCLDNIDGEPWGVLIELIALAYAFVGVAIVADSHLVVSLETLCVRWKIPEDVAGASFMAFGSAAPEIIINAVASIKAVLADDDIDGGGDDTALGIGAIIGSGMIAFTVIPGCCAVFAGQVLELKRRPLARDAGAYAVALIFLCVALAEGNITLWKSGAMLAMYAIYMIIVVFSSSIRQIYRVKFLGREHRESKSFVQSNSDPTVNGSTSSPPLQSFSAAPGSAVPMTVVAMPDRNADTNTSLWDALPVQPSPMEFTSSDIGASLNAGSNGSSRPARSKSPRALVAAGEAIAKAMNLAVAPLSWVLTKTCPPCEFDTPYAYLYPLTLVMSFLWVSLFSTIIAAIVTRFGDLLGVPSSFLGMYIIAIGAEIPDTIQSVTVAKRGYGSMAVSNSTGSQIINILIGLGFPWFISNLAGREVRVKGVGEIQVMAYFQAANVVLFVCLLLLTTMHTWRPGDHSKAQLGVGKGIILLGMYLLVTLSYAIHLFVKGV